MQLNEQYDAVGNIRRTTSTHAVLNQNGAANSTTTDDYWFRYDAINRLVTDRGVLSGTAGAAGTTVVRGNAAYGTAQPGQDYVYDLLGQKVAALRTDYSPGSYSNYYGYYSPGYYQETRENYDYDGAGRVAAIRITQGSGVSETYDYSTGLTTPPASIPAASASGGANRSLFGYDLSGRQISQTDYDANGSTVVYSHTAVYAMNGQLTSDYTSTLKYESNGYSTATYATASSYSYSSTGGEYLLGAVGSVTTTNTKNNVYQNGSSTTNSYLWYDSAVQGTIDYKPNTGQSTVFTTSFLYDAQGTLTKAHIADGRVRDVTYRSNADGQIIRRDEADTNYNATTGGDPHELWYRFAGKEFGYVGNNGTSKVTEDASIADRRAYQNTGAFRNGSSSYASASDFAQSSAPINSYSQGTAAGGYTVQRSGETLRSVAQSVWGDASLWYKLADANGMKGDMALAEGQHLTLPAGVSRTRNNAATLTPYNPNDAIGNVSPSTPQPAARNNHCGIFGAILRLVIAAVVSLFNPFAAIPIIGPVTTDAIAQGIDIAVGLQDKFDFAQSGITAIAATVDFGISQAANALAQTSGALRQVGQFVKAGTPLARAAVGALSNAITQGVAVATGLQSKFDFAGVAAAGVAAGVSRSLSTHFAAGGFSLGERLLTSTASGLANAATRSVIAGTDFGDNIIAALPAAIVNTFSDYVTERITGGAPRGSAAATTNAATDDTPASVLYDGDLLPPPSTQVADLVPNLSAKPAGQTRLSKVAAAATGSGAGVDTSGGAGYYGTDGTFHEYGTSQVTTWLLTGTGLSPIASGSGWPVYATADGFVANFDGYVHDTGVDAVKQLLAGELTWDGSNASQANDVFEALYSLYSAGSQYASALAPGVYDQVLSDKGTRQTTAFNIASIPDSELHPDKGYAVSQDWILDLAFGGAAVVKDVGAYGIRRGIGWFAAGSAESASLSVEAQFRANSLRLADEGHGIFTQSVANGDIFLNPRLSVDIQRGNFVDQYIRDGNIVLRDGLGLDASTVRINQRLYAPSGKYTVPDLHFPGSGNSIDYSYQLKNATTPQIMRIQQAVPNGTITIVPPAAVRPVYTIRP